MSRVSLVPQLGCSLCAVREAEVLCSSHAAFCVPSAAPIRSGHLLVAARRHVSRLSELSLPELGDLMTLLSRVTIAAERVTAADRYYMLHIGDKVEHYHFHLIPHFAGDAPLGPFIFGVSGWAKALEGVSYAVHEDLCRSIKALIGTG